MRVRDAKRTARAVFRAALSDTNLHVEEGGVERAWVGTILGLTPSGKVYTPFACSNVTPCPRCDGGGCDYCGGLGSREAHLDAEWWDAFESIADRRGWWVDCDGSDIYICRGGDE
jgi:hypothetical protein